MKVPQMGIPRGRLWMTWGREEVTRALLRHTTLSTGGNGAVAGTGPGGRRAWVRIRITACPPEGQVMR